MKGLAMMIKGNLDAIPGDEHLCHKKGNIIELLTMLQECEIAGDVYNFNCVEARQIAEEILSGIFSKASPEESSEIFSVHFLTIVKLIAVSYYEQLYSSGFTMKISDSVEVSHNTEFVHFVSIVDKLFAVYS